MGTLETVTLDGRDGYLLARDGNKALIWAKEMETTFGTDGVDVFDGIANKMCIRDSVNIILDPIFIFVFRWGMMGAAVATVLGQVLTAALSVWYLCHMKAVRLGKTKIKIGSKMILTIAPANVETMAYLGLPSERIIGFMAWPNI